MKIRHLLLGAAVAAMAVSCEDQQTELGLPSIEVSVDELVFDKESGDQEITIVATRDWIVDNLKADWIVVSPSSGKASAKEQTITVSVLENTKMDRSEDIVFTIGMASRSVTVKQAGPGGSADALILYANDFDKETSSKTFGTSGESWPYLDQFDGWQNHTGTGASNVVYAYKGMSVRSNSASDSNYSDYEGSGKNNLFFGSNAYFKVGNIALNGAKDFELTFGTEKYSQDNGSVFQNSEFHIWLSKDGSKWVEFKDYTFAGGTTEGRWNLASAHFSVPEGTANLSVCLAVDVASSYRADDLKLVISETAGTAVDFSAAVDKDFGSGSTGGEVTPPENIIDLTVAEFNEKPVSKTDWYRLKGAVGTGNINTTYGNFDIVDETGTVYVYGTSNIDSYKTKLAAGGKIVFVGQRGDYNGKVEVLNGYIESYEPGEPVVIEPKGKKTVEEFIAAADKENYYELSGTVSNFNSQYSSFDLTDATGTIFVYSVLAESKQQWAGKILNGASITLYGKYLYYEKGDKHEVVDAYIVSCEGGEQPEPGEAGEYDPQGITWTLGTNAYDNTSQYKQTATVNGVAVANLLKLGTSSKTGDATIKIPAGTSKVGFYAMSWKGKPAEVKITMGGNSMTINPPANEGVADNPPYTITLASDGSDYFEIAVPTSDAVDVKVETTNPSAGRVIFIGLKAIAE